MEYEKIQNIVIVYGTKTKVKQFLKLNTQIIEKDKAEKINLIEIKNNTHSFFKYIKNFVWKGD